MNYLLVAGYGWSGSSALVDLLREYDNCYVPDIEFRLIKDPKGIRDLYLAITKNWDALNVDIAIRDFVWFTRHLGHRDSRFPLYSGLGYEKYLSKEFTKATDSFLNEIIDFKYESHWFYLDFVKNEFQLLKSKVKRRMNLDASYMYFSAVSEEEFLNASHKYIDNIFRTLVSSTDTNIVLDQAVSAQNCIKEMCFVPNSKLIIVDRDPRDIYADLLRDGNLIGKDLQKTHDVSRYIKWHRALRASKKEIYNATNVLFLNFEDLIFNYDNVERRIEDFLNLKNNSHVLRKKFFNPNVSKQNVGLWKTAISAEECRIIEEQLKDDLIQ